MKHSQTAKWLLLPVALIMLLVLPSAFAQENTAGFQGVVKDPSGAVIANASVEVSGPALQGTRKVQTDGGGNYRFGALPVGTYNMTVTAPGFRTHKSVGIDLTVGRLPTIDVQMEVGAVTEVVEVSGAAPIVDVTQSKVAITVEQETMTNLPKGRSFQSLIPFAAGARQEPLQAAGQGTRGTNGFQIDGASDSENVFMVDGVNITNIQNGGIGKNFQMDFTEEVQIKSSSFEAEYGGALGGVINAIGKKGSNTWHGSLLLYYQNQAMNANNSDRGIRTNPAFSRNTNFSGACVAAGNCRLDAPLEYYYSKPDQESIVEPGYTLGGPLLQSKLWIFSSYIPTHDTTRRTTNFTGLNPGPRTLTNTFTQHNAYNRLDWAALTQLRLYASWNYSYSRTTGTLGGADSPFGQRNTNASTDPNTLRADNGSVNPNSFFAYGADWTPTSKLVVSARYGYLFQNNEQRGTPVGTRYQYNNGLVAGSTKDIQNNPFPASAPFNTSGFANIPSNLAYAFDAYKRDTLNLDTSYFAHFLGTHTFKGGFYYQRQSNAVLRNFNGGYVTVTWGTSYAPVTSGSACDQVKQQNVANYGAAANVCQGKYGYFTIGNNVTNTGTDQQTAKALYFQDSWQAGHGLTLNLGLRFDNEFQPAYDPTRFPSVSFGWGDKIAPRLGFAYDVLHNGKVKVYASYGQFYDIMKMGLARGSFGSDYWHNCVYAMDDPDYTKITPTLQLGGGCPASGPAPGVSVGRFIENVDFRATKADPRDPAISPSMKPMKQHEFVTGMDWAIKEKWGLEIRYSRKRLDRTIEDMSITDNLGFYIGNPGTTFADLLHRPVSIPCPSGTSCVPDKDGNYLTSVPFCAECPKVVGAIRNYDGLEFRFARRATGKWFGAVSYSYSKLRGNYPGLTNSDPTDGTQGRHSPNNSRLFDLPSMTYLPSGQIDDGPLSTDRPHTAKLFGNYLQKWHLGSHQLGETNFGFIQIAYQGTPINTCLPVVGTSSACQWGEGRGNFVKLSRAADGSIVSGGVVKDARTSPWFQTDIQVRHEIKVKEGQTLVLEGNILNLFNQRADTSFSEFAIPTSLISPNRASRFPGDPILDWGKVMNGYNYIDALNGKGAFAGNVPGTSTAIQNPLTLASLYGHPNAFQTARSIRLAIRYQF